MSKRILTAFLLLISHLSVSFAGEGMWLPIFLKSLNEAEMQSMGMKISAEDIYSVNKGSLKDAIVHFGGFCTAEVISTKGLLLTNHHCGYDNIQSHSSVDRNLLKNGFWAKNHSEELPNPGLFAQFIDRIEDITTIALEGVNDKMTMAQRQAKIDANIKAYRAQFQLSKFNELIIRPFYAGNQYFAFFTTKYNDVRLVGTPQESIGKFGSDTDNWVWPRHTGDFSLFRIYAGPNNEPADYSPNNKPFTPKHSLPISLDGVSEGDFTMVFGFPGRTNQYLSSVAVEELMEKTNPARIKIRDNALKIIDKYMRQDEATKIQYASKYARVANYWKKWIGENQGLYRSDALGRKRGFEAEFTKRAQEKKTPYGGLFEQFNQHYKALSEEALVMEYFNEIAKRNVELLANMGNIRKLVDAFEKKGVEGYTKAKDDLKGTLEEFYKDYNHAIDQEVAAKLIWIYREDIQDKFMPAALLKTKTEATVLKFVAGMYKKTALGNLKSLEAILVKEPAKAVAALKKDPAYMFFDQWQSLMTQKATPVLTKHNTIIDSLQNVYMRAQMELFPDKRFYPDANFTLRVTYGQVEGFQPEDGRCYTPKTYLDGAVDKYIPGDYEFDLPKELLDLYERKDYGPYADETGKVPLCFLGSNHTTGGNSGSPAIDAYGNLVGLNFDRVWEGTMSDINYDRSICRNIMVDTRYILFVMDKLAGAKHLVDELNIVYPKTGK